jgi:hypothetical protein
MKATQNTILGIFAMQLMCGVLAIGFVMISLYMFAVSASPAINDMSENLTAFNALMGS